MSEGLFAGIVALLGVIGQLINLFLYLRIKVAVLEVEKALTAENNATYTRRELCLTEMKEHERRLEALEEVERGCLTWRRGRERA